MVMLRLIGIPLMYLAMFSIAGGHWALLQGVAWADMLWKYSRDASLVEAFSKTFSGEHPCALCKTVNEGRSQEEKLPATQKVDKKVEIFPVCEASRLLIPFRPTIHTLKERAPAALTLFYEPPVPVPLSNV